MAKITIKDGSTISYHLEGDISNPVVIFVNGSIFNYKQFNPVLLPALKKILGKNYSYLQYDYVGISNSSELTGGFDFSTITRQHVELMDALGIDKAHHFGYSKGSLVSFLTAANYPDRVISVAGYGNPNLDVADDEMTRNAFIRRRQALSSISGVWDQKVNEFNYGILYDAVFLPMVFPGKTLKTISIKEKVKNKVIKSKLKPMLWDTRIDVLDKLYQLYTEIISEEDRNRYIEEMKGIKQPVLLLHGTNDETVPLSASEKLADWIDGAKLIKIKDYEHTAPVLVKKKGKYLMTELANFIKSIK